MADNQEIEPVETTEIFYPDSDAEPLKPTEEEEGEIASDEELNDESEVEGDEPDDADETDGETDAEESEEVDDESEEEESLYVELDGQEISLDEIREMKKSHDAGKSMQADYTKKSMANADEAKALKADREALNVEKSKLSDMAAELEALVAEDEEVDWDELKEYDEVEYYRKKEKADARKRKVAEIKAEVPKPNVLSQEQLVAESNDLFSSQGWKGEDGKLTDAYEKDMAMATEYMSKSGYSEEEVRNISYSHHWKTILDAARFHNKPTKKSALEKKVKKAPLVTKPKKQQAKKAKSAEDVFYST